MSRNKDILKPIDIFIGKIKGDKYMSVENKFDQAKGSIKEGFGKLTGDSKTQAEGTTEKTVAKLKEVAEEVKETVEGAVNGLKNSFKKED
ncbi:CsbD-like protein [Streptococcus peroris ATCC 700780]|uniref:CsbD-like protein n=2 Tax=Streptococcus peroris TaxID=68891 RepID=E8KAM1_9STRE|nr:CsbD-like protein [Streptococcus peroris ATCC 700780]